MALSYLTTLNTYSRTEAHRRANSGRFLVHKAHKAGMLTPNVQHAEEVLAYEAEGGGKYAKFSITQG
jgi:hypothetical protein